ncbi:hypothetical protein ACFVZL_36250 [Streptomyces sp. NPDC058320]|uniref:hypothetical protein n=1 Tax=unclassified Streptomyces TaxID=2593676 RepID=UPI003639F4EB
MFFKGSRYEHVPDHTFTDASGRPIRYKTARFIPDTPAYIGHRVVDGERLDHLAWQHYRDPERFWRICDANSALWPPALLEQAAIVRIPPSEG